MQHWRCCCCLPLSCSGVCAVRSHGWPAPDYISLNADAHANGASHTPTKEPGPAGVEVGRLKKEKKHKKDKAKKEKKEKRHKDKSHKKHKHGEPPYCCGLIIIVWTACLSQQLHVPSLACLRAQCLQASCVSLQASITSRLP